LGTFETWNQVPIEKKKKRGVWFEGWNLKEGELVFFSRKKMSVFLYYFFMSETKRSWKNWVRVGVLEVEGRWSVFLEGGDRERRGVGGEIKAFVLIKYWIG
jgi:hypothetical protein